MHVRVIKLLDILVRRDKKYVPLFLRALVDTDQMDVADMLGYKGLHTFVVLLIVHINTKILRSFITVKAHC